MLSNDARHFLEESTKPNKVWVINEELYRQLTQNATKRDFGKELIVKPPYSDEFTLLIDFNKEKPYGFNLGMFFMTRKHHLMTLSSKGNSNFVSVLYEDGATVYETNGFSQKSAAALHNIWLSLVLDIFDLVRYAPEIIEGQRVGTKKNRFNKNRSYSYLNILNRKNYVRKEPQGTHKSPIEHLRRAHTRRINTKDGVKEIDVKCALVNKGNTSEVIPKILRK